MSVTDYTVDNIARALSDLAASHKHIAKAMEETNRIELAKQKREWIQKTGDRELADF
jgi:hypothetical protein